MTTAARIANVAYRFWIRAEMTEWPTVRYVARRLGLRQLDIEECEGDGTFMLTMWNAYDQKLGDYFVEADTPAVEAAWSDYWKDWSV